MKSKMLLSSFVEVVLFPVDALQHSLPELIKKTHTITKVNKIYHIRINKSINTN